MFHTYRKVLVIAEIVFCLCSSVFAYSGGSGEPNDPYQIADVNDLLVLGETPTDYNKCFILTADVNLQGVPLTSVGNYENNFTGVFDGCGHIIHSAMFDSGYAGLFGCVGPGGQIRNLGVEDVNINGGCDVGGIVGHNSGTITDCYTTGTVTGGSRCAVGGLAGLNDGNIIGCHTMTTIKGKDGAVGGLVGKNGDPEGNINGVIVNCYSTGTVTRGGSVGGLVGTNYGTITACHAEGAVSGNSNVGGLAGENAGGTITDCYATGTVVGNGDRIGGLIGYGTNAPFTYYKGVTTRCYATGSVSGINYVGGLIGVIGNKYSITDCYATGAVTGGSCVGGLAGQNSSFSDTIIRGLITNCYATGAVEGTDYVGGLFGRNKSLPPDFISDCYATGAVSGNSNVGGLAGYNEYSTDIFRACFWDVNTSGQTTSAGGTGKTTAEMKTLAIFISTGWDFSYIDGNPADWVMPDSNYPHLAWEYWKWAKIPDVRGISFEEAADTVKNAGFLMMGTLTCVNDETVPVGYIVSQDPPADANGILEFTGINMVISCPNQINAGSGTISDPYQIRTIYEWLFLTCHQEFWDKYFILMNDLDFRNGAITPIANNWDVPFTGVFDGNSHIIRNVVINMSKYYVGLFGCVNSGGQIHNLGVESVGIIGNGFVGGLVGKNNGGDIAACYATGSVSGFSSVGGLVGVNDGNIIGCYSIAMNSGDSSVGGLAGNNYGTITACYAAGEVSGYGSVGGLVGANNAGGNINKCYSAGEVNGLLFVGGLAGRNDNGSITACFWDIETSGQTTSAGGGRGLTTSQMKSVIFYQNAGWADNGWVINDGVDYPHLAWENTGGVPIPQPQPIPLTGSGTEQDPYQVWTGDDFTLLNQYISVRDKHIALMADLDLSGIALYPIGGDLGFSFTGVFDGNGHTIRNMNINMPGSNNIGLFASVNPGGQIRNLGVEDVNIIGGSYVGAMAGINDGNITNCYVTGTVTGSGNYVGGLVGYNYLAAIADCCATGTVHSYSNYVGGLVGYNDGGTITACNATGTAFGYLYVGGLIGWNNGNITNCYAMGTAIGDWHYIGGLIGVNYGRIITACYSTGAVSGGGNCVGGLIGVNYGGIVIDCYSTDAAKGAIQVGGLIGYNGDGTITDCYATGAVTGSSYVGGLIGQNDNGNITACFWDIETSSQITSAGGGRGLTTSQMKSVTTYQNAGWAGEGWVINDGVDYPRLAWENTGGVPIPQQQQLIPLLGSGTEQYPYQIQTVDDFALLSWYPSTSVADKHFTLTADLDLSGIMLFPIGDLGFSFTGVFDGNGHTIRNVNINMHGSNNIGLFASVSPGGQIRNLRIEDVNIIGSSYVGAMAGMSDGNITNCYVTGAVTGSSHYVGGLIGVNHGRITACYTTGTASGGGNCVGGLIGVNYGGIVIDCYSTDAAKGAIQVGGLIGYNGDGTITDCYATGAVTGSSYVGGLIGQNDNGNITACFWDIETSSQITSAGGTGKTTTEMRDINTFLNAGWDFVGESNNGTEDIWEIYANGANYPHLWWDLRLPNSLYSGGLGTEADPYRIATVSDWQELMNTSSHWNKYFIMTADVNLHGIELTPVGDGSNNFIGVFDGSNHIISNAEINMPGYDFIGLFGYVGSGGQIRNLGAEGVNITGGAEVGGLVGFNLGIVTACYATGAINGVCFIGGLAGENFGGTIINCYAAGAVYGDTEIGGLTGCNTEGTITNCYASGIITGGMYDVGGLAGYNYNGVIMACFWDVNTSGLTTSAGGTGKTTNEMKDINTFLDAGWDFLGETENGTDDIWRMCVNGVYYPHLRWEYSKRGDFVCPDGVYFEDLAYFLSYWLLADCSGSSNCDGADMNIDGAVNMLDFAAFAENWLVEN